MQFVDLVHVIQNLNVEDAFKPRFTLAQWTSVAPYLLRQELSSGERLITQGEQVRTMYLLGSGLLTVFVSDGDGDGSTGANQIAILRPGSVVGEPCLFNNEPRMANVEAVSSSIVWVLGGPRFDELTQRAPLLAMELLRAAGAVMAIRMRASLERRTPQA